MTSGSVRIIILDLIPHVVKSSIMKLPTSAVSPLLGPIIPLNASFSNSLIFVNP